jgi:hypothetical protein
MMLTVLKRAAIAGFALLLAPAAAEAADIAAPQDSGWSFAGALYGWGAGINGEAGVFGLPPQDLDLPFSDILQDLDFAFMGLGEARNGRFVFGMDLTYSKIGTTVDNPRQDGALIDSMEVDSAVWMVTGFGGYTVYDTEALQVDVIGGARYWSVDNDFKVNTFNSSDPLNGRTYSDGAEWVDPLVGVKLRADLTHKVYVTSWGMIGGFGLGSDVMWDVMAGAGYSFTDHVDMFAGYRAVSVDYADDGFVYDMVQQGPLLAAVVRF